MNHPLVHKAFALIIRYVDDGRCQLLVLELKSVGYAFYRLPAGNVEDNETPLQAAHRETYEESGIKNLQLIRKIGTTRYFKPFIQADVDRTDYLFTPETELPDTREWIGTVGAEAEAIFSFSWITYKGIDKVDPELRTFLTKEHIPELFAE